ncbi:MAG: gamma-glutamyl-gamma-aminobutyrate hydrolase family protein [Chloroflexota bacterium]|nr:gamma-glutamyl-gamma-aminobutyrate hydrolase family protein [Chloroflexota bacterium]
MSDEGYQELVAQKSATHQSRPLIGVTGHRLLSGGSAFVGAGEAYLAAIRAAGGTPVVLVPGDSAAEIDHLLETVDGLLFTGGQDVDPLHFGEAVFNDTVSLEPDRDAFELPLARAAVARDVPTLAICRGCQVLNVALGGSLWQDLPAQRPAGLLHRQRAPRDATTHAVHVSSGSLLGSVLGASATELHTNTFHHQAARDLPDALVAVAYAPDGTIEALEAPACTFMVGVQWHPEHLAAGRPEHHRLFRALVDAAARAPAAGARALARALARPPGGLRSSA